MSLTTRAHSGETSVGVHTWNTSYKKSLAHPHPRPAGQNSHRFTTRTAGWKFTLWIRSDVFFRPCLLLTGTTSTCSRQLRRASRELLLCSCARTRKVPQPESSTWSALRLTTMEPVLLREPHIHWCHKSRSWLTIGFRIWIPTLTPRNGTGRTPIASPFKLI